jgi:hypothetical protein
VEARLRLLQLCVGVQQRLKELLELRAHVREAGTARNGVGGCGSQRAQQGHRVLERADLGGGDAFAGAAAVLRKR